MDLGMPHILVVDDDADFRTSLQEVLAAAGFSTTGAANGREALEVLGRTPPPSAILLDLMMPVMDGWSFRKAQLADPALTAIPVVLMSASADLSSADLGVNDVVCKPFRLERVVQAVRRACSAA
jgi:CheY-like chemotaxis protein